MKLLSDITSSLKIKLEWVIESILDKIVFVLTHGHSHQRTNHLSHKDILKAYLTLRKGDIILLGNLKRLRSVIIPGPFTHAAFYLGHKKVIHATPEGVGYATLHHLVSVSDTFAILRIQNVKHRWNIITKAAAFAKQQLGSHYDSFFRHQKHLFFCTELINSAFHHAGYHTGLRDIKPFHATFWQKMEKKLIQVEHWLMPEELIRGRFKLMFLSHNLEKVGRRFICKEGLLSKK